MIRAIFDSYGFPVLAGIFVLLFVVEGKFDLRKRVQGRWKRIVINTVLSIPAFALLRLMLVPVMVWLATKNETWHIGLLHLFEAPAVVENTFAFLMLDYSTYLWHIVLHKLPLMWRFHLVHHTDLDLDITTAFRFHFGEMFGSTLFRGAAVLLIGASPLMVIVFEIVFEAATQFHHSTTQLPFRLERMLSKLIVTPRMHGIHHSMIKSETDSNYSVIFSFWDRLHNTARLNVPQQQVVIGVPAYADEKELTIERLLALPFGRIRDWADGERAIGGDDGKLKK